jgi:hypothetical protein
MSSNSLPTDQEIIDSQVERIQELSKMYVSMSKKYTEILDIAVTARGGMIIENLDKSNPCVASFCERVMNHISKERNG